MQNVAVLNVIKKLRQQGIDKSQILEWERIRASANIDLLKFREELQKCGGIIEFKTKTGSYLTKLESDKRELEEEISKLQSRVSALSDQKAGLEAYLAEARNQSIIAIKEAGKGGA